MSDPNQTPHLEFKEVYCRPPARPALRGASFAVRRGVFLAIAGPNGSGKGTLCRCLARLLVEQAGQILMNGVRLPNRAHALPALGMMVVLQGARVFAELTVRENLLSTPTGWRRERRSERFAAVLDLFPQLKDRLGQAGGTLSGGEQQMVAIGRALMANPALLVLEEPSMGLAVQTTVSVYEALATISREGKTVIVTEEALTVAGRYADVAGSMEQGRIIRLGSPREISAGITTVATAD